MDGEIIQDYIIVSYLIVVQIVFGSLRWRIVAVMKNVLHVCHNIYIIETKTVADLSKFYIPYSS